MDLNMKEEIYIKEEFLDFTEDHFINEDSDEDLTVDASNKSETFIKDEPMEHVPDEGLSLTQFEERSIKDEPMEHVFVEELSFNHSEVPRNLEVLELEEKSTKTITPTEDERLIKHELLEHVPDEGLSFNQSKESKNLETFKLKQRITKSESNSGKTNTLQYIKKFWSERKEESMKNDGNSSKTIQKVSKDGQKKFQCSLCSYGTNFRRNFKSHLIVHSDSRPFKCSQCELTFKRKDELKSHLIVIHSDLRYFKCSLCDAAFIKKSNLNRHLVVHSDLKPFKCSHCESAFKTKVELKRHMLIHSGGFICSVSKSTSA